MARPRSMTRPALSFPVMRAFPLLSWAVLSPAHEVTLSNTQHSTGKGAVHLDRQPNVWTRQDSCCKKRTQKRPEKSLFKIYRGIPPSLWTFLPENIPYNIQWMFPGLELDKTIQESLQSQNYQQRIIQII